MATSKTLTPTNVTIQIPAFTDKPDQRVNSNCIDKEADAINALSTMLANIGNASILVDNVRKNVTSSYASIGQSFTLTKTSIVIISQSYSQQLPISVGAKSVDTSAGATLLYGENAGQEESVAALTAIGVLGAGTYYIWAKSKANTSTGNVFTVTAIQIVP